MPFRGKTVVTHQGDIYVRGVKLENTTFDYPITINSKVEHWIDYFTGKGRPHFARYLERSELFIPYITPLLKENGLPEDLVYLAMIESGFNNHARSHAKAVGPWQFISATGKRYGLAVNWWVDERRDTRKSTLAAVEYLRDLFSIFRSWELAAAAYNAGESKVARAVRRFGTKDFWVITRHKFLRPETRDYVPKIIAAAIIAKNRTQFGFAASNIEPGEGEAVAGNGEVVKLEADTADAQPNPSAQADAESLQSVLRSNEDDYEQAPAEIAPATLTIPADEATDTVDATLAEVVPQARAIPTPKVSRKGDLTGEVLAEFELQSPADLLKVARAAGLSYHTVKALNPELLRWCTPPNGGTYRVKIPVSAKDRFLTAYNHESFPRKVKFLSYKVRPGETLTHIARRYGFRTDPMSDLNRVSAKAPLRTGSLVLLPMPNDRSRAVASLDLRDPPERRKYRRSSRRGGSKQYKVSYKRREAARAAPRSLLRDGT
jgi:membrane-bound lytic murein transglycosylase D